jgi:hypothetical protein
MITTVGRSRPILLENGDDYVAAFQKAMADHLKPFETRAG